MGGRQGNSWSCQDPTTWRLAQTRPEPSDPSRWTQLGLLPQSVCSGGPTGPEMEVGQGLQAMGVCPRPRVCALLLGSHRSGAFTHLDGQHPDGEGSGKVDVGFEGVEDHRVTALGERTR